MADSKFVPGTVRDDLKRLEETMKRLAVGYELFLIQSTRWPPNERKAECEAIVRHYTKNPPRQTADRFRFHTLVHRYRTNLERWRRRLRALEESGEARLGGARGPGADKRHDVEDPNRPFTLLSVQVDSKDPNPQQLRDLYLAYRQARKARGMTVSKMGYGPFVSNMSKHLEKARAKSGGGGLELRVDTLSGKVRIAVRPVSKSQESAEGNARSS